MLSPIHRRVVPSAVILSLLVAFVIAAPAGAITYGSIEFGHAYVGAIIVDLTGIIPNLGILEWCSGALVSARVFLTAGHCVDPLIRLQVPTDKVWVSFAVNIWQDPSSWRSVSGWELHPDYNWGPTSDPHDIGAIVLAKRVRDIAPAKIAPVGYLDGLQSAGLLKKATFINVGYGSNESFQVDGWRKISYSSFQSLHDAWLYMSQNIHSDGGGTCFGDSGGPTFYNDGTTEWIVATVSWGDAMCVATNINYRADLQIGQDFVYGVIASAS